MTAIIYPQLIEIARIDLVKNTAVIDVELFEVVYNEYRLGGGGKARIEVSLDKILTRDEKKQLQKIKRLWAKGFKFEFMIKYHTSRLDVAIENFYRGVLARARMRAPINQFQSAISYLKPVHFAMLERLAREKANEKELADKINEALNFQLAAAQLRQEASTEK